MKIESELVALKHKYCPIGIALSKKESPTPKEELIMDLSLAIRDAYWARRLMGTQADVDTWGEYSRRYDKAINEVNELLEKLEA